MKLVVGLGNPGRAYEGTRHNIGFKVLETIARRAGSPLRRGRFQGQCAQVSLRGCSSLLLWPLTWMNLSGASVLVARDFYKIEHSDILIICDDFQISLDSIRLRGSGSAGGQKGLADILERLGTLEIPRLRVGIGPVEKGWDPADYVLARFPENECFRMESAVERAADCASEWAVVGIESAMNRFN